MSERAGESVSQLVGGIRERSQTDGRTDGRTDGQTDRQRDNLALYVIYNEWRCSCCYLLGMCQIRHGY